MMMMMIVMMMMMVMMVVMVMMLIIIAGGARGRGEGRGIQWTWCVALIWTGTGVLPMTEVFIEVKRFTQRLGAVVGMGQEGTVGVIEG